MSSQHSIVELPLPSKNFLYVVLAHSDQCLTGVFQAYNTAGKELAHVDYAVQLDKYLSGHYVLLDKDALEKVIVKCKVTVFTENNVLGGDGNGIELFRS